MFGRSSYIKSLEQEVIDLKAGLDYRVKEIEALMASSGALQREIDHLNSCLDEERRTITSMRRMNEGLIKQRRELREALAELRRLASTALLQPILPESKSEIRPVHRWQNI